MTSPTLKVDPPSWLGNVLIDHLTIPALTETDDAYILDVDLGKDSITEF